LAKIQLSLAIGAYDHVRDLLDGALPMGATLARWDARDGRGRAVAPGLYFARLTAAGQVRVTRVFIPG